MMLTEYKYQTLVFLLGLCDEMYEYILVYDYLLDKIVDVYQHSTYLCWNQLFQICIGTARGLQYLHNPTGMQQQVLYRDIKSANIQLDENCTAKVSDYGIFKSDPANQQYTFLVSNHVGTRVYCDIR